MNILVTGGAGFIGSNFVRHIRREYPNYAITVVDDLTYAGDMARLADVKDEIRFVRADICNFHKMNDLMQGIDIVVHFAAHSHVDRSIADPGPFLTANILGTDSVARAAIQNNVRRFHHISTDEVFGTLSLDDPDTTFNESTPYDPRSPYAASKASSDHIVRAYGESYGLPYTITNCSNNYGEWDSPGRVIPVFIACALDDKPLPLYGSGQAVRDYLFVGDHCMAIDLAIHAGTTGQTYCVGGGAQRSGLQIAQAILDISGKSRDLIEFVTDRPGHDMRYAIDASLIKKELGWRPKVTFEQGLQRTLDWYVKNQAWWRPLSEQLSLMRQDGIYNLKAEAATS
jgi:dTDP-glucose 4,6-dehydratase